MQMEDSFEMCKLLKNRDGVLLFHPMINIQNTVNEVPPDEWFVVVQLANGEPRTLTSQEDYDDLIKYLDMPKLDWESVSDIVTVINADPIVEKIIIQSDSYFGWEIAVQTKTGGNGW